jgi:single-stranded DNA-binding protein
MGNYEKMSVLEHAAMQSPLLARVTREPQLLYTVNGNLYCRLGAAQTRLARSNDGNFQPAAIYFDVKVWGSLGEWVATNVHKGDIVLIAVNSDKSGAQHRHWEGRDGEDHSVDELTARVLYPLFSESWIQAGTEQQAPSVPVSSVAGDGQWTPF